MLSERDARKEGQEILNQTSQLAKEKAQRNMVWAKVPVVKGLKSTLLCLSVSSILVTDAILIG